jgi:hypothetical protein
MAHAVREVRKASASTLPRGMVITALALMSWGLVIAGWKAATLTFSFLIGG